MLSSRFWSCMVSNWQTLRKTGLRRASQGLARLTFRMPCIPSISTWTQQFLMRKNGQFKSRPAELRHRRPKTLWCQARQFHTCLAWAYKSSMSDRLKWTTKSGIAVHHRMQVPSATLATLFQRLDQAFQRMCRKLTLSSYKTSGASSVSFRRTDLRKTWCPMHSMASLSGLHRWTTQIWTSKSTGSLSNFQQLALRIWMQRALPAQEQMQALWHSSSRTWQRVTSRPTSNLLSWCASSISLISICVKSPSWRLASFLRSKESCHRYHWQLLRTLLSLSLSTIVRLMRLWLRSQSASPLNKTKKESSKRWPTLLSSTLWLSSWNASHCLWRETRTHRLAWTLSWLPTISKM